MSFESAKVKTERRADDLEYVKIVPEATEKKLYQLETGESVEVIAKTFEYTPSETEKKQPERNVVFLPGWKMDAESAPVDKLGKAFAEKAKGKSFAISTRTEGPPDKEDALYKEAVAISKFIKEKRLTNIVLAGHSQGGDKAIDLAAILQHDPELNIGGLVLLDSVGLYEQTASSLTKDFIKDSMVNTPATMVKNPKVFVPGISAGNSVVTGIFKEVAKSGTESLSRMTDEVRAMARQNPRMEQISIPVILISGAEDPVSSPDRIIPPSEEKRLLEEWEKEDEEGGASVNIDPREKFLQESTFPNSPYVRAVFPEKLSHHGLPLFRSESVANASLYLLKRFERRERA